MSYTAITDEELDFILKLAQQACQNIQTYRNPDLLVQFKHDDEFDPLTAADQTTDDMIRQGLSNQFPDDLILSEENSDIPTDYSGRVWMIDPLDGTKEFVDGGDRYAVMIGLCLDGQPILGVVAHPVTGDIYYARKGAGAFLIRNGITKQLHVNRSTTIADSILLVSRAKGEPRASEIFLRTLLFKQFQEDSSFGLRAGMIAEGVAEAFVATNVRASKWDICAPQIILEEAGGKVTLLSGSPVDYKQPSTRIGVPFVSTNRVMHQTVLDVLQYMPKE